VSGAAASLIGWCLVLGAGLALDLAGRLGNRWPTAGQVVAAAMRTPSGRVLVLGAWLWLGVHFLAR
jgi:hypothetical protein